MRLSPVAGLLRRLTAAVAILATLSISASPWVHDDADDALCETTPRAHDHSQHHARVGGEPSASHSDPQHCVVCHVLKLHRAVQSAFGLDRLDLDGHSVTPVTLCTPAEVAAGRAPARAPPFV